MGSEKSVGLENRISVISRYLHSFTNHIFLFCQIWGFYSLLKFFYFVFLKVRERMKLIKETREKFGRFFYRFPEGESAADVFDRVSSKFFFLFLLLCF